MRRISYLLFGLVFLLLAGCASTPSANAPSPVNPGAGNGAAFSGGGTYQIGVDDQLQVSVWRNPDLSVSVPVRPDGKISVPLIGDVQAGGQTPDQVATGIKKKLANYIRDPQVTVIVTELRSHEYLSRVRVAGAIQQPLSVAYRKGMTVLDLVLQAGGVTEFASPNRTKLYRRTKGKSEVLNVRLDDIMSDGRLATNYYLEPGDIISVPERLF